MKPEPPTPEQFKDLAVLHAITLLFKREVFDIGIIQRLSTVLHVPLDGPIYHSLILLSGTKYAEWTPELMSMVKQRSIEILKLPPDILDAPESQSTIEFVESKATSRGFAIWRRNK